MKPNETKIWFPSKKYGWGWGPPVCWQGWAVMAAYVALVSSGGIFFMPKHPVLFFANIALFSTALIIVCYLKGEKPGWRWGGK